MRNTDGTGLRNCCIALAALFAPAVASAQILATQPVPPDVKSLSPGNVDMRTGVYVIDNVDVNIGLLGQTLDFERQSAKPGTLFTDNWTYKVTKRAAESGGNYYTVESQSVGHTFFSLDGSNFQDVSGTPNGVSKLEIFPSGTQKYFVYTMPDGTRITFNPTTDGTGSIANSIVRPNGLSFQMTGGPLRATRISDNRGYTIILSGGGGGAGSVGQVCVINATFVTPPSTNTCPVGARSVSYTYSGKDIATFTDLMGQVSTITYSTDRLTQTYFKPGIAQAYMTLQLGPSPTNQLGNVVTTQTVTNGPTITYGYDTYGGDPPYSIDYGTAWTINGTATGQINWGLLQTHPTQVPAITPTPNEICDEIPRCHAYDYNGQFTAIVADHFPSGRTVSYTYDGATSNITKVRSTPPSGSSDPLIDFNYTYDCTVLINCHKPKTAMDPRDNVTDFVYDPTNGNLTTATRPAPAIGGVRPQTRYTWTQFTARYRNTSGVVGPAPSPVWVLTQVSECRTTASCTGTADETRTTFTYPSGSGAYNPWPVSKTLAAGDGSLTATITYTYDQDGNVLTALGPLANQTTRYRYDAMRRIVGVIGPDPDGAGPLKFRAVRYTYDAAGRLTKVERGTVPSQSDPDWANFAPLLVQDNSYDIQDRLTKTTLSPAGGAAQTMTQMSYDSFGRRQCAAVRMDPAQWASQTDSCVPQTTGPNGPDRIARYSYDAAGDVTLQQTAYGTTDQANELTLAYTNNGNVFTSDGMVSTLKDAENNLTTFEYDGHDRLVKTRYPLPTKGSNASSTTDYEQLTYDLASNITSRRLRDASAMGFTYDNLNRATLKDLPGIEPDVIYGYDNQDRLTSASQTGNSLSFTFDALGRNINQIGPQGTAVSAWDAAGRRIQLTYPGTGLYVTYDYLLTGETTVIHENGGSALATYTYDDLGNERSVTFANGLVQNFTYDPISRLATLSNDLPGTTNDLSVTLSYNSASQIGSTIRTGDAYAWTGHGNGTTAYTSNGLNQQVTIGGASATWDTKGNLTTDPQTGKTYGYSSENLLTSAGGATLTYDPLLRLYQVSATTRFAYDGPQAIAEYGASNVLQRRFVFGPGMDEPIAQYEGSGTGTRRFLSADERGSIISQTDNTGALIGINTYDEYGKPGATNIGRYQFTGQKWIGEAGVYDYKARDYLPHLGIFAQADPVGYASGPNLYGYALGDPVNFVDPFGLIVGCVSTGTPTEGQGPETCTDFGDSIATMLGGLGPFAKFKILDIRALQHGICEFGNWAAGASDKAGKGSLIVSSIGVATLIGGIVSGNEYVTSGGAAVIGVGAVLGTGSVVLQGIAGTAQVVGGAAGGQNLAAAAISLGTGLALGAGLQGSIPRGWHGQNLASAVRNNRVAGNVAGTAGQLIDALAPRKAICPK